MQVEVDKVFFPRDMLFAEAGSRSIINLVPTTNTNPYPIRFKVMTTHPRYISASPTAADVPAGGSLELRFKWNKRSSFRDFASFSDLQPPLMPRVLVEYWALTVDVQTQKSANVAKEKPIHLFVSFDYPVLPERYNFVVAGEMYSNITPNSRAAHRSIPPRTDSRGASGNTSSSSSLGLVDSGDYYTVISSVSTRSLASASTQQSLGSSLDVPPGISTSWTDIGRPSSSPHPRLTSASSNPDITTTLTTPRGATTKSQSQPQSSSTKLSSSNAASGTPSDLQIAMREELERRKQRQEVRAQVDRLQQQLQELSETMQAKPTSLKVGASMPSKPVSAETTSDNCVVS